MAIITVHLACKPETGEIDPSGPALIIGPDGATTGMLLPGELVSMLRLTTMSREHRAAISARADANSTG
jgi:hypothetical protein